MVPSEKANVLCTGVQFHKTLSLVKYDSYLYDFGWTPLEDTRPSMASLPVVCAEVVFTRRVSLRMTQSYPTALHRAELNEALSSTRGMLFMLCTPTTALVDQAQIPLPEHRHPR